MLAFLRCGRLRLKSEKITVINYTVIIIKFSFAELHYNIYNKNENLHFENFGSKIQFYSFSLIFMVFFYSQNISENFRQ